MSDRVTLTVNQNEALDRTTIIKIANRINKSLNIIQISYLIFPTKRLQIIWESVSAQREKMSTSRALEIF